MIIQQPGRLEDIEEVNQSEFERSSRHLSSYKPGGRRQKESISQSHHFSSSEQTSKRGSEKEVANPVFMGKPLSESPVIQTINLDDNNYQKNEPGQTTPPRKSSDVKLPISDKRSKSFISSSSSSEDAQQTLPKKKSDQEDSSLSTLKNVL